MSDKEMLNYAKAYRTITKVTAEISNDSEDQKRFEIIDWLLNQAEKTQKYREALEEITKVDLSDGKSHEHYQDQAVYMKITALKALEESK